MDTGFPMTGDEVRKWGVFAILSKDRKRSFGAGVCVSPEGHIVTCFHVMCAANYHIGEMVQVNNGTKIRQAEWIDANKAGDLALLRTIDKPEQHFFLHNPAENEEKSLMGQRVACWGYPNGVQTLSPAGNATIIADWHTVEEPRRRGKKEYELDNANGIEPGYSGGPIFRQNNLLVGILYENPRSVNGRAVNKSFGIPVRYIRLDMPKYAEHLSWENALPESHNDISMRRGTLGTLQWTLYSDGRLMVDGRGSMQGDVPSDWEEVKRKIRSVDVCGDITDIADSAFKACPLLKSLRISSSVTRIGFNAFANCPMLESVNLSDRTEAIGAWSFADCISLSDIRLPANIGKIGMCAFENCRSLKRLRIPLSVSELDIRTFANCESLEEIELPYGIRRIGREAFSGCTQLKSVHIPDSIRKIGFHAFYDTGLTELEIPSAVEATGDIVNGTVSRRCNPFVRTLPVSESSLSVD